MSATTNPPPANLAADEDQRPIGVVFRLNPGDHEVVTEYARSKKMSIQALMEAAINRLREAEGLAPIKGRPRSKTWPRR